jgi:DNA-binding response OmpR family regulator
MGSLRQAPRDIDHGLQAPYRLGPPAAAQDLGRAMRLLLIEDNVELARLLASGLAKAGLASDAVETAAAADLALQTRQYAAAVLDLGLPDGDGLDLLKAIRARRDPTPVLILTSRGALDDRILGLQAGADDYLLKPFALEELTARLHALLRRPGQFLGLVLEVGELTLDSHARQVFARGQPLALTARELSLVELLMRRSGRVVLKQHIEDQLFGLDGEVGSNAVEVLVHRLRRKLEPIEPRATIHTVRGVGYLLSEDDP